MSSSGDWSGEGKHLYFNDKHKKLIEEKKDHLQSNYDGIGDFFLQKLQEEEVLSPEEKLQQVREKKREMSEEEQRLEQVIQDRKRDQKLDRLENELRDKQDRLRDVRENGVKSFSELMLEESEKRKECGYDISRPRIAWTVKNKVERKLDSQPDVEELKKEVDSLQRRVAELNGGREKWFMELDSMEVSA